MIHENFEKYSGGGGHPHDPVQGWGNMKNSLLDALKIHFQSFFHIERFAFNIKWTIVYRIRNGVEVYYFHILFD